MFLQILEVIKIQIKFYIIKVCVQYYFLFFNFNNLTLTRFHNLLFILTEQHLIKIEHFILVGYIRT